MDPGSARFDDRGYVAGLTATADGRFYALWIDNRTGVQAVWGALVGVER